MITRAITQCLELARTKGWKKTYWAFDIHGTLLRPNYQSGQISHEFYPHAKEVMQRLSQRDDIVKILFTSSYREEIRQYRSFFASQGIHFNYFNENPEVADGAYGYYQDKFYFNVLFDDKAGFDGDTDWVSVLNLLNQTNIV